MGLWLTPHYRRHHPILTHTLSVLILFWIVISRVSTFSNYNFESRLKSINKYEHKFPFVGLSQRDKQHHFGDKSTRIKPFIKNKNLDHQKLGEDYFFDKYLRPLNNNRVVNHSVLSFGNSLDDNKVDNIISSIKSDIKIVQETINQDEKTSSHNIDDSNFIGVNGLERNKSLNGARAGYKFGGNPLSLLKDISESKDVYEMGFKRSNPASDLHSHILDFFTEETRQSPSIVKEIDSLDSRKNNIANKSYNENVKDTINLFYDHEISNKDSQKTVDENYQNERDKVQKLFTGGNFDDLDENKESATKTLQEIQPSASVMEYLEDPMEYSGDLPEASSFEKNEVRDSRKFSFSFQRKKFESSPQGIFANASSYEDKEPFVSSSSLPDLKTDSVNQSVIMTENESNDGELQDIINNASNKKGIAESKNTNSLNISAENYQFTHDEKIIQAVNAHAFIQSKSQLRPLLENLNLDVINEHKIKFYSIANHNNQAYARCMDGTPPGYYLRKGWASGESKWIIHLHGGAWCYDLHSCSKRRGTILGSTKNSAKENINSFFHGILSKNPNVNPHFFNWNVVVLSYCDGGLFSGNRKKFLIGKGKNFYFQGRKILKLLIEDLHKKSLQNATDVILSGTSAGGLAVVLQGDYIRHFLPKNAHVRGLCDAGIFLDRSSSLGLFLARQQFKALYSLHKPILNRECLASFSKKDKFLCLFPEYALKYLKLPIFLVNSLYDHWQLSELEGIQCVYDEFKCDTRQHDLILNFRNHMYSVLTKIKAFKNDTGIFANSCLVHGQAIIDYTWSKVRINNSSIENSFFAWFLDRNLQKNGFRHIKADCKYPCNGTCPKVLAQRCVQIFKGTSESRRRRDAEIC